ncbi:MAG: 3-oxoacyl-(acyl-carrier-protein) synthase 3 [Syntrophomonadaceae bacterium]|nr:3-oxoacyl-(acyl-carrier-protein) synthase 3 [Bacillota bacterium]
MCDEKENTVGIASLGIYLPSGKENGKEIALKSDIPLEAVENKLGLLRKSVAAPHEHVSDMALKAAKNALGDFDPAKLDAVIYFGSEYKDYPVWSCACKVQYELGAVNAFATEIMSLCVSFTVALRMAKGMMLTEESMRNVLLVMGSKESYLIDYKNPRVRFMYNFADGGAAALLTKFLKKNVILETHNITAGFFHKYVKLPAGGSAMPASRQTTDAGLHMLELTAPEEMKEHLDPVSFKNFVTVVEKALEKSGKTTRDLNFLAPIHLKRSLYHDLLQAFRLNPNQSFYLENYGHIQSGDQIIVLTEAERRGLIKDGDIIALLAAGTGYTWGATIIQWGNL